MTFSEHDTFDSMEPDEESNDSSSPEEPTRESSFRGIRSQLKQALGDELFEQIALERSREAFAEFYDLFQPVAQAQVLRVLGSAEDARDIVQEVFVQFWEKAPEFFRLHSNSTVWVLQLAKRRAIDETRRPHFRKTESFLDEHELLLEESTSAEEPVDPKALQQRVLRALDSLTVGQRRVMDLVLAGHAYKDIAVQLDMSEGAVRKSISDAYQKLRPILLQDDKKTPVPQSEPLLQEPRHRVPKSVKQHSERSPKMDRRHRADILASLPDFSQSEKAESNAERDALLSELEALISAPNSKP